MKKEKKVQGKSKKMKLAGAILAGAFAAFSIASFVIVKINFDNIFARTEVKKYSPYIRYEDVKEQYGREMLSFSSGKNKLQGYLYGMENTKGLVVISHGLGGGAEDYFSEACCFVDNGYQVFGYDNTGCYNSEGENCAGLPQSVSDLDAALDFIEGEPRFDGIPVLLYGHSWGGYAVTAIFNYDHDIAASVSVAGFNKPMEMIMEWGKGMMGGLSYVEYPYIYLYQRLLFGENIDVTAVDGINKTDTPILLIHGDGDTVIDCNGAGTVAYKNAITNPNVQYKICKNKEQNGHNTLAAALDAIHYGKEMDAEHNKLYEQYDGKIPEEKEAEFYGNIDKQRASELDEAFVEDVLEFYEAAVRENS